MCIKPLSLAHTSLIKEITFRAGAQSPQKDDSPAHIYCNKHLRIGAKSDAALETLIRCFPLDLNIRTAAPVVDYYIYD